MIFFPVGEHKSNFIMIFVGVISIVNKVCKPTHNWGGTTLNFFRIDFISSEVSDVFLLGLKLLLADLLVREMCHSKKTPYLNWIG